MVRLIRRTLLMEKLSVLILLKLIGPSEMRLQS